MNRKLLIYILVCFLSHNSCWAQVAPSISKVCYTVYKNFDISSKGTSELLFSSKKASYTQISNRETTLEDGYVKKHISSTKYPIYYTDLKSKKLYTEETFDGETYLAIENSQNITWHIKEQERDTIMGFECNKAVGSFRGREYTVWFTPEIPVAFGPWKLQGLPGLILEAQDHLKQIRFIATKVEFLKKSASIKTIKIPVEEHKNISLKEYVHLREEDIKRKFGKILSSLPRNSNVKNIKTYKYKGLELKYEWEDDTTQD